MLALLTGIPKACEVNRFGFVTVVASRRRWSGSGKLFDLYVLLINAAFKFLRTCRGTATP